LTGRSWTIRRRLLALLLGAGGLSLCPGILRGQQGAPAPPDTAALSFLGFTAGQPVSELQGHARDAGRGEISCLPSASDLHLSECRGGMPELDSGRSVDLWAAMIDDRAAILTLSGRLTEARLARWRDLLEGRYGAAVEQHHGPMWMLQWVRRGRMLRLSWRAKGREFEVSASLTDGPLLDGWANQGKRATR
jgi:hypothetical protein